ncbi:carbon-nitrogen hydrolase [Lineolata rhizophorae]|uniref:Carbon-nitrogen hydrolase n=1 Tax=Lineolata rhizophorae TaxID=578093 RepID=A0A6A6P0H7_9PEZI|nr:carbon-nitrogen hydrolase [Lineolata rhizophorae]
MKIATLQFWPRVGQVEKNIQRANCVLERYGWGSSAIDWLILPEMAFSGYNFPSLEAILSYAERPRSGPTYNWASSQACRLNCLVTVGYPEMEPPENESTPPRYFNSTMTVDPSGTIVATYRKSFLYYTDETWAQEGSGFFFADDFAGHAGLSVAHGICMDINPYRFERPWTDYEFATHVLEKKANVVVLSMAWLTNHHPSCVWRGRKKPELDTVSYWIERFRPLIAAKNEPVTVVFANRCGQEGKAVYAGSSCVMRIANGGIMIYKIAPKLQEGCIMVDLDKLCSCSDESHEHEIPESILQLIEGAEDHPMTQCPENLLGMSYENAMGESDDPLLDDSWPSSET